MKQILTILAFSLTINFTFGQSLKTFNGQFDDGRLQSGNATYTYYEDPNTHKYVKQGAFSYTFIGQGDYAGFNQKITGSFDKGLKTGTWNYSIIMTDFGNGNPYATGTITLTSNYKNGYADGNWKEVRAYKNRKRYLVYGQYKWEPFEALKTMIISMNFKNGYLAGAVSINDEIDKFKATGSYDQNSLCIGTWVINNMAWGKNSELIYKDNTLYEFIARGNNGEVLNGTTKYQYDYDNLAKVKAMSPKEREEAGMALDTVCGNNLCAATNNIKEYFPRLFSIEYFLYKFIGGDLSFDEGFKGGCNLQVSSTNYSALSSNYDFGKATDFYKTNDLLKAYEHYSTINLKQVKPSERKMVTDKISLLEPMIGDILELYHSNGDFFYEYTKSQYDSLEQDKSNFANKIELKTTKDGNDWTLYTDESGVPRRLNDNTGWAKYNFEKPWENQNWEMTKACFENNKGVYSPIQMILTEEFFKYNERLKNVERSVKNSSYSFRFENTNNSFYTYDKNTFLNYLVTGKKEYNLAKSLIGLHSQKVQIENLNKQNKKKILFSKYQLVYQDFNTLLQSNTVLLSLTDNLNKLKLFSDKVIALYSQETKDIEKQLKSAETGEQIKTLILAQ